MQKLEVIRQARSQGERISILADGQLYSYSVLIESSHYISSLLLGSRKDLQEERIAFMVEPGFNYVSCLWGIWQAGGIAVPLSLDSPAPAVQYVLDDAACRVVLASPAYTHLLDPLCESMGIQRMVLVSDKTPSAISLPEIDVTRRAMILYTSGTTNQPKGVVTTHRNLNAQISTLVKAWKWTTRDHTLCVLPLHHVHGIINVLSCSLWSGARCEFIPDFDPLSVFRVFLQGQVNVFMAVPTIYYKLIAAWERMNPTEQQKISAALKAMRLMVSGSAALPVSVMDNWEKISGHKLLERYGMTELGMAISNPYDGPRKAGKIGLPLEGVDVRLCDDRNIPVVNEPGEIQVRGENVFLEYWRKPEATQESFTPDGWFKTGDIAVLEEGYYRILGRSSVDIIKSGGFKISALEIEEVLRTHPMITDCAVVGLADEEWGEVVAAALVVQKEKMNLDELTVWLKERISAYRVPRRFLQLDQLPRNAMGKVTKKDIKKLF